MQQSLSGFFSSATAENHLFKLWNAYKWNGYTWGYIYTTLINNIHIYIYMYNIIWSYKPTHDFHHMSFSIHFQHMVKSPIVRWDFCWKKKTKTPGSWIVGSPGGWPRLYMAQPLAGRLTAARDDFRVVGVIYHGYTMVIDGDTRPGKLRVCELEHGPVEIVDFLIQHGDFSSSRTVSHYQRVHWNGDQWSWWISLNDVDHYDDWWSMMIFHLWKMVHWVRSRPFRPPTAIRLNPSPDIHHMVSGCLILGGRDIYIGYFPWFWYFA